MSEADIPTSYAFGPFRLFPAQRRLLDETGCQIGLRDKSFDLLCYLVRHRGRLVEKQELLTALWPGAIVEENNLNQAMTALRHALADDVRTPKYIATIKGRGYQFVGSVTESSEQRAGTAAQPGNRPMHAALVVALLAAAATLLFAFIDRDTSVDQSIVVERFDDANLRLVTDEPGSQSEPVLSPDGRMIAYVSDAVGQPQIWVRNLEHGDPLRITDGPYPATSPTWTPKGDRILFARMEPTGPSIFSVGALGTTAPRLIIAGGANPRYALHADIFAYTVGRQIWLGRNGGSEVERLRGRPESPGFAAPMPAPSPGGDRVAFIHADQGPFGNVWVIPVSGGPARQLTTRESASGFASSPAWTADGRYIVFTVDAWTVTSHLWRTSSADGQVRALTSGSGGASQPTVSAGGRRLAYTNTRFVWRLTRIEPESGRRGSIYESRNPILLPDVSPDGSSIVFFTKLASGMQLYVIDADGSNPTQLSFDEAAENVLPTWHSDGEAVVYFKNRSLHRMRISDGADVELFEDFHWSSRNSVAVHGDRLTYHEKSGPGGARRTVVRQFGESDIITLPVPIEAGQWDSSGTVLLGFHRASRELMLCRPGSESCQTVDSAGQPVRGIRPQWSLDEQYIYFLRQDEFGECCAIHRIDKDGSNARQIAVLEQFQLDNSFYGIVEDGAIVYNHLDRSTDEIWLAEIDD